MRGGFTYTRVGQWSDRFGFRAQNPKPAYPSVDKYKPIFVRFKVQFGRFTGLRFGGLTDRFKQFYYKWSILTFVEHVLFFI